MSENQAVLKIEGKDIPLPIVQGTEGEKALMIAGLRQKTGYVTLDPSFMNTAACFSKITYVDGEKGILRYRGIPVEELVRSALSSRPHICSCMVICRMKIRKRAFRHC